MKVDLILSNDYGDGNENGKKARGVDQQNNYSARASRFFVHFLPSLHDYDGKMAKFIFCARWREHTTKTFFFSENFDTVP